MEDSKIVKPRPHKPEFLPVPDSNVKIFDGNIVMFDAYSCVKWVAHHGLYKYEDKPYKGWYFTSIPEQDILPVHIADLKTVVKVSNTMNDPIPKKKPKPCPPPGPEPFPPGPELANFTVDDKKNLDRAWLTVETLEDRDSLDPESIPNGKIVRVNDVNGEPRTYIWSAANDHWEDYNIATMADIEDCRVVWEII